MESSVPAIISYVTRAVISPTGGRHHRSYLHFLSRVVLQKSVTSQIFCGVKCEVSKGRSDWESNT
jgi:hypothetical protein